MKISGVGFNEKIPIFLKGGKMSKVSEILALAGFFFLAGLAFGQNYTGTYVLNSEGVTVTLVLQQDAQGNISGTLSSTKGTQFKIDGTLEEGVAVGLCSSEQGAAYFEAELQGNKLRFSMFDMDANNNPDYSRPKNLEFVRQSAGGTASQPEGRNPLASPQAAGASQNSLAQRAPIDPFIGTFVSQDLTLSLQGSGEKYSGTLNFSGQAFPVTAQKKENNSLEGTFKSSDMDFPFSATLQNDIMKFTTEGTNYTLKKQAGGQASAPQPSTPIQSQLQGAQPARGKGNAVNDPQMGISFTAPAGWIVQKQQNGYLLASDTYKGFIIIMPHNYSSLEQMNAEAQQGIVDEQSGIQLQPVSDFQPIGRNGLAGEFSGMLQGQIARAYAIGLISPRGGGVTILTAVESGNYTSAYPQFVQTIASSVTFMRTQAGSGQTDASLMQYFAGKYYSYSSGSTIYGSAGTERQVMLCPNGQFYDSSEFSASGQDWGGANTQQGAARWQIQGNKTQGIITIIRPNGSTEQVEYQVPGGKGVILLNGIKFAYAGAPECR
jgi:hypothetical protein